MLPVFLNCWCRRYAAHFTTVGATFYTTAPANAARFHSVVGVGVILPFTAVDATLYTTARVNAACSSAVSVSVMLHILLLLAPPFIQRLG